MSYFSALDRVAETITRPGLETAVQKGWLVLVVLGVVVQIRTNQTFVFEKEMYVEGWG